MRHWRQEMDSAALFGGLAAIERIPRRRRAYARLAEVEARHAERFAVELERAGVRLPPFEPSWRTRVLLALARRLGTVAVLPRIAMLERRDARGYRLDDPELAPFDEELHNATWLTEFAAIEAGEALRRLLLRCRRTVILLLGGVLFAVSLALARNVQLEGLVFGVLTGVVVGPVTHYALGKVAAPLAVGRVWCGWACWTAALLDQLPYRRSPGWLPGGPGGGAALRQLRYAWLLGTVALVLLLVLGLGYSHGAVGADAALWFLVGNGVYWLVGAVLAVAFRDNRAFCKYACPVSLVLRTSARPALVKLSGDADACRSCRSQACVNACPMDVRIPDYVKAGTRLLSSECIACLHCVAVCPPNTLRPSVAFDVSREDLLRERGAVPDAVPQREGAVT